jgi:hypothetical protein
MGAANLLDNYIPAPGVHNSYGGGITSMVQDLNFTGLRRPYLDKYDRPSVTINRGRWTVEKGERRPIREHVLIKDLVNNGIPMPVTNATALRKEEWIMLDQVVLRAARFRLRAWADLANANSFGGFNGFAKLILEHETMTDPGEAIVDMDGVTEGRTDGPQFQLQGLPLPITHSDFWCSSRFLATSRNTGTPFDATMGEASGRRVAESIEKVTIGVDTGVTYGGASTYVGGYGRASTVYGYINFPSRLTSVTGYSPLKNGRSGSGWKASDTLADVLAIRNALYANKFYGPFVIYHSNDWDQYLDNDYILTGGNVATQTLRNRLRSIEGIADVRRLDFLTSVATAANDPAQILTGHPFRFIVVELSPSVARAVNGMDITTVMWEMKGGMQLNFKVMAIQVPQLRADAYGNCGISDTQFTQ